MTLALPRWITPVFVLGYVAMSNVALATQSRLWATAAVALFVLLLVRAVTHPRWWWAQIVIAIGGALVVIGVATALLPPVPLLLPPVVVPAALAWLFGHTLLRGRVALVERFALAVYAPEPLDRPHAVYARGVTILWSCVLALMALGNLFLVLCLTPGGILQQLGYQPTWPVDVQTFLWLNNGTYLLVPLLLVAEFAFRLYWLKDYRFRNPLAFVRRARERLPAVVEEVRRG